MPASSNKWHVDHPNDGESAASPLRVTNKTRKRSPVTSGRTWWRHEPRDSCFQFVGDIAGIFWPNWWRFEGNRYPPKIPKEIVDFWVSKTAGVCWGWKWGWYNRGSAWPASKKVTKQQNPSFPPKKTECQFECWPSSEERFEEKDQTCVLKPVAWSTALKIIILIP